jgi:predicted Zn-dependent peptidase
MIKDYFGPIPKSDSIQRVAILEDPITEKINTEVFDSNIQIPALITAYRTPSVKTRASKVLDMISTYLSDGKSSKLYKKMVDKEKTALNVATLNFSQEDYGIYIIYGLPMGENSLATLEVEIDEEIEKIQSQLISEKDYQKLQNKFEKNFVDSNTSMEGIASSLGQYYVFHGNTNLINSEIDIYRSITRDEIREVAKKYLNPNQRIVVNYLPESSTSNPEKK